MIWYKKGHIFKPSGNFGWMNSHAQVPSALHLQDESILRVYFSTRPNPGQTQTTFLDLDSNDLSKIKYIHDKPVLQWGSLGTFDEHGIMPSSVVQHDNKIYLYYSGWQRAVGVPYNNYTGLAISEDGGITFKKHSESPIIDRNNKELYSATSPCVIKDNDKWRMWYCSGTNWHTINDKLEHTYDIKYAFSDDGYTWTQTGKVCIKQDHEFEAITKPAVIRIGNKYHMWYCYRGSTNFRKGEESYRIGYATSANATDWKREDGKSGIEKSKFGWDSMMIAYPEVIKINEKIVLLYNGNSFGTEGFGYAELSI
jgi:hypothetical protein